MAVEVFAADEQSDQPVDTLRWIRLAEAVLQEEELAGDAELSVLFVDERSISELNARFLGKDGPTDVLAFPIDEEPVESGRSPDSGGTGPGMPSEPEDMPVLLGDIVICPAVAFRNAPEHAGTYEDELALLVVHGLLHLMGMDHAEDDEAEEMEAKERELLARHHAQIRAEAWPIKRGDGAGAAGDGSVPLVDGAKGAVDAVSGAVDAVSGTVAEAGPAVAEARPAVAEAGPAVAEAGPAVDGDLGANTGAGPVPGQDIGKGPEAGEDDPAGQQ